ncbi:hypothetical protein BASA81_004445 [Batrachochytrium salamandrivorans]|nr:hypothetical protein BASA81_004445 [Batrachochytrium salamandrivorans]
MSNPPLSLADERAVYKTTFNPSVSGWQVRKTSTNSPHPVRPQYIRTRHNNVRCFPQCSDPHKGTSFCGRTVEVSIRSSSHGAEEAKRGLFFGEFRKASDAASFRVGELAHRSMLKEKSEQMVMGEYVAWSETEGFQFVFNPKKRWTCLGRIQDGEEFVLTSYLAINGVVQLTVDSSPFLVIPVWKIEDRKRVRISQTASRPAKQVQAVNEEDEDAGSNSSSSSGHSPGEDKPKLQSKTPPVPFMSFVPTRSPLPVPALTPPPPRLPSPVAAVSAAAVPIAAVPIDFSSRMRYPSPVHNATNHSKFAAFQPLGYAGSFHTFQPPPSMNMYSQPPPPPQQQAHFHPSLYRQGHFSQRLVPPASPLSPVPPTFPFAQQLAMPIPSPPPPPPSSSSSLPLSPTYWHHSQQPSLLRLSSMQQQQASPPAKLPPSSPNNHHNNQ